jgi:hypothetical protein
MAAFYGMRNILERQPLLINTPSLDRWIAWFENEGIDVRESVVRIPDQTRRSWIQARREALEEHVSHWKNRSLVDKTKPASRIFRSRSTGLTMAISGVAFGAETGNTPSA